MRKINMMSKMFGGAICHVGLTKRLIQLTAGIIVLCYPMFLVAQSQIRLSEQQTISISDDDFANIAQQIKSLKDPTFRAFLRSRILTWLTEDNDDVRLQSALLVASDGLADIQRHRDQIWPATAGRLRESLINSINRWSPSEANALARKYPLQINEPAKDDPVKDFTSAISKLNDPKTSAQGMELATKAILNKTIPPGILLGELLRLDESNSPQLPQILSVVLSLEENQSGSIPLHFLNFLRSMFLKKTTPDELQIRFLTAVVTATRLSPVAFRDPAVRGPASELLNGCLPHIQKLLPAHYPEAAGRLQELNSGALTNFKDRQAAENRINLSDRPLEQMITEADETHDKLFKRELLERAARLAAKDGKLRQAVDLMVSKDNAEDVKEECGANSATDEFLNEIVTSSLKDKDLETSEYAASKMYCPVDETNALRIVAVRYYQERDRVRGQRTLAAAAKSLKSAADGTMKAHASLGLAEAFLHYEPSGAQDAFHNAVESINKLPRPKNDEEKEFYLSLLPLAEDVIKAFRTLARQDRGTASALSVEIRLEELRACAAAGIDSRPKP